MTDEDHGDEGGHTLVGTGKSLTGGSLSARVRAYSPYNRDLVFFSFLNSITVRRIFEFRTPNVALFPIRPYAMMASYLTRREVLDGTRGRVWAPD